VIVVRVLIDTNIIIPAEDFKHMPENLAELLRVLSENDVRALIQAASIEEINRNGNKERREIILSKIRAYPILEGPPIPTESFYERLLIDQSNSHDVTDAKMLYALYRDAVDFLITEDKEIRKWAWRIELEERVFSIDSALEYFKGLFGRRVPKHPLVRYVPFATLDVNDSFFDSLREDYPEFNEWFAKSSRKGRNAWVYEEDGIQAFLAIKEENEPILTERSIPARRRVKISTFKVQKEGYKFGELFLKIVFNYCVENNFNEVYLTHFVKENDKLVELIMDYGFQHVGKLVKNNEDVFLKYLIPPNEEAIDTMNAVEFEKRYYPSYKDGRRIRKFIIPIRPEYHDRLFPDYRYRQMKITEFTDIDPVGNTIKKVYLSHSRIGMIRPGDLIMFYRSHDQKAITTIGVVERVLSRTQDLNRILRFVGKRTVYTYDEIVKLCEKPTLAIRFKQHFFLRNPVAYDTLLGKGILRGAPQSIMSIGHDDYVFIKERGGIDGRYTFD